MYRPNVMDTVTHSDIYDVGASLEKSPFEHTTFSILDAYHQQHDVTDFKPYSSWEESAHNVTTPQKTWNSVSECRDYKTLCSSLVSLRHPKSDPNDNLYEKSYTLDEIDALLINENVNLPPGRFIFHRVVIDRNYYLLCLLMMSKYRDCKRSLLLYICIVLYII